MDTTTETHAPTAACAHCHAVNRVGGGNPAQAHCGRCGRPLFDGSPVELDDATFAHHLRADTPLVVDFWAPWCGPCRTMAPIYQEAAAQLEPDVRLGKVNTDVQGELAGKYAIRSIPTLAIFEDGREVARHSGVMELSKLVAWVRSHA